MVYIKKKKKKEMASWEYFYAVYIEVPHNLQFIEG